jgi:hypothetical protein
MVRLRERLQERRQADRVGEKQLQDDRPLQQRDGQQEMRHQPKVDDSEADGGKQAVSDARADCADGPVVHRVPSCLWLKTAG